MKRLSIPRFELVFYTVFFVNIIFLIAIFGGMVLFQKRTSLNDILENPELSFAVLFTLKTSLTAVVLAAVIAMPCGYILSRGRFPGKVILDTLIDLPIILPPLVSGVALLIFFGPVLGENLSRIGLEVVFSPPGVIVAQCFIATPFAIRTFRQAFDSIDPRMENIARTLGCSPVQVFFKVTVPAARKGIIGGITLAWARTIGEFGATAMLAGVTRLKTETLAVAIYLNMAIGDLPFSLTVSVLLLFAAMAVLVSFRTVTRTGERI
ncbi:MAG: ABC transporter permease subunit [Firmicutes bacterium]|nr:ABC transporter permease subunit [Bacillota bacterium]